MIFETCLEQIFKQFKILWIPIEGRHCCSEGFGQFWNSIYVVVEVSRIAIACRLLRGHLNLGCFNCGRGVPAAELWLTCGALRLSFSWRNPRAQMGISSWTSVTMWEAPSGSESIQLRDWQTEYSTSGWRSFWERSPSCSSFSTFSFLDVLWKVPESVRVCGFKINSSNSVLLNSWDSFWWVWLPFPHKFEWCIPQ